MQDITHKINDLQKVWPSVDIQMYFWLFFIKLLNYFSTKKLTFAGHIWVEELKKQDTVPE